jgi:glycosyltransferase involved in cell wall biosynthesis
MKLHPLKLALVTRRYPPMIGGAEKVFSYLATALSALGADVTVLTSQPLYPSLLTRSESLIQPTHEIRDDDRLRTTVKVEHLPTSPLRVWGTLLYMSQLARWFRNHAVDIAYVSMLKHDAYTVVNAARRFNFPVVLRPEGAGATGDMAWQSWGNFGRWIGRQCRHADAFVAISAAVETELREAWERGTLRPSAWDHWIQSSRPMPPIATISNGVPIPDEPWRPRALWSNAPRAVFVGRLAPEKGLFTLVDAWPQVRARYPAASLVLIGEGPERSELEARVKLKGLTLGAGQAVYLPGTQSDPGNLLCDADLFVLPSQEEGMSIALLEAMALGMPLVASAIPGNCRLVRDLEHGRLVPPGDPDRLAAVILGQWSNFDRACQMAKAARRQVEEEFSIQVVARRHLELFEEIISRRRTMKETPC